MTGFDESESVPVSQAPSSSDWRGEVIGLHRFQREFQARRRASDLGALWCVNRKRIPALGHLLKPLARRQRSSCFGRCTGLAPSVDIRIGAVRYHGAGDGKQDKVLAIALTRCGSGQQHGYNVIVLKYQQKVFEPFVVRRATESRIKCALSP